MLYHELHWRALLTSCLFNRLRVCDTDYIADYPLEKPVSGTSIQLWEDVNGKNQIWVLEECESRFGEVWRLAWLTRLF